MISPRVKKTLSLFLFYLTHLFITGFAFVALQHLFAQATPMIRATNWQTQPLLLLADRALYALVFAMLAWILFHRLFPHLLFPSQKQKVAIFIKQVFSNREKTTMNRAIISGLGAGLILFIVLSAGVYLLKSDTIPSAQNPLATLLKNDVSLLLTHLLTTGVLTAFLEEFFYRGCLCAYMLNALDFFQSHSSHHLPQPLQKKQNQQNTGLILLFAFSPNIFFALVHPKARILMFGMGFVFTYLYFRWGLLSSIVSHATYNSLILLAGTYIQE